MQDLIVKKTLNAVPINAKDTIEKIERELLSITRGELDELQQTVVQHENFLGRLLESEREDEQSYREKHKQLTLKLNLFDQRFKVLKKEVFNLIKLIDEQQVMNQ